MLFIDYPSGIAALLIILLICVVAFISTISGYLDSKENEHLHNKCEALECKVKSLEEYAFNTQIEKDCNEYKKRFRENMSELTVEGDKNV